MIAHWLRFSVSFPKKMLRKHLTFPHDRRFIGEGRRTISLFFCSLNNVHLIQFLSFPPAPFLLGENSRSECASIPSPRPSSFSPEEEERRVGIWEKKEGSGGEWEVHLRGKEGGADVEATVKSGKRNGRSTYMCKWEFKWWSCYDNNFFSLKSGVKWKFRPLTVLLCLWEKAISCLTFSQSFWPYPTLYLLHFLTIGSRKIVLTFMSVNNPKWQQMY